MIKHLQLFLIVILLLFSAVILWSINRPTNNVSMVNDYAAITQISEDIRYLIDEVASLKHRLDGIDLRLASNNMDVNEVSDTNNYTFRNVEDTKNHIPNDQASNEKNNIIKDSILTSLTDQSVNITTLMESEEMKSLPIEAQHEVMNEVVRRFNNEEIDRYQFIPGYKE